MKRYRVAMVAACPFPAGHGTPVAIREMVNALAQRGHQLHVITYPLYEEEGYIHPSVSLHRVGRPRAAEIKVGPFAGRIWYDLRLPAKIVEVVRRYELQILHVHNYEGLVTGIWSRYGHSIPLVYNAINLMEEELPTYRFPWPSALSRAMGRWADTFLPGKADFIVANTPRLRDYFISQGIPGKRIEVVPTGIDLSLFESAEGCRVAPPWGADRRAIVYTGTLDAFQNLPTLFRAVARLSSMGLDRVVLVMIPGTAKREDREALERLAGELGIGERICWVDASPRELPVLLSQCDVGVAPRRQSAGMPVKILNYMAVGLPVVAYKEGAPFLREEEAHWIRKEGVDGLAEALHSVLTDETLAGRIGEAGRRAVFQRYSLESVARQLETFYAGIVGYDK